VFNLKFDAGAGVLSKEGKSWHKPRHELNEKSILTSEISRLLTQRKSFKGGRLFSLMRFIIRAKIPTEAGNKMVKDPNFLKNLEDYMNKAKPEAAYFFEADGNRVMAFIVEMQSVDEIPALAEPLFQGMGANVEFHPVMSFDDLKKALPRSISR
jgi:hypothetical protein